MKPVSVGPKYWRRNGTTSTLYRISLLVVAAEDKHTVHMFLFTFSESGSSFEEVCSGDIPGRLYTFFLPTPPVAARYALDVLAVEHIIRAVSEPDGDDILEQQRTHFAVRVDYPDPEQDMGNRGRLTLRIIPPTPSVNVHEDEVLIRYFDSLSGRVWFSVWSI